MLIFVHLKTAHTLANISNVSLHHSQQIIFKIGICVTVFFLYYILLMSTKQVSVYTHTHTQHTNKKYSLLFKAIIIIMLVLVVG